MSTITTLGEGQGSCPIQSRRTHGAQPLPLRSVKAADARFTEVEGTMLCSIVLPKLQPQNSGLNHHARPENTAHAAAAPYDPWSTKLMLAEGVTMRTMRTPQFTVYIWALITKPKYTVLRCLLSCTGIHRTMSPNCWCCMSLTSRWLLTFLPTNTSDKYQPLLIC